MFVLFVISWVILKILVFKKEKILRDQIRREDLQTSTPMEVNKVVNVRSVVLGVSRVPLLQAVGKLNGKDVRVVFDTGAQCTCVSSRIIENYDIKSSKEKVNVIVADSRRGETVATEPVNLEIFDKSVRMKLVVLEDGDRPILIGLDWLNEVNAIIDTKNRKITIGSKVKDRIN